jgi:hypothetical protein
MEFIASCRTSLLKKGIDGVQIWMEHSRSETVIVSREVATAKLPGKSFAQPTLTPSQLELPSRHMQMCTLVNDPFIEPFYSLKKAFTRLLSPVPESTNGASIDIAYPSSAISPILINNSIFDHPCGGYGHANHRDG